VLASLLWGDRTTAQSKKYFRQTLWQLQQVLHGPLDNAADSGVALRTNGESVQLECQPHLWLDTAIFEAAFAPVRGMSGEDIDEQKACSLRRAVDLYKGELLEGWYQDWCLFHRERLRNAYELMLDKLMAYCEARRDFEGGQSYGELLLRQDQARERTYYRLMRLYYLAGDRARAFRLFQRCEEVLKKELGVQPGNRIVELYNKLRTSQPGIVVAVEARPQTNTEIQPPDALGNRLRRLRSLLLKVRRQLESDIREVDAALATPEKRVVAEKANNPEISGFLKRASRALPRSEQIVLEQNLTQPTSRTKTCL
jgi:DNA-binding SARP family transcriptional activator